MNDFVEVTRHSGGFTINVYCTGKLQRRAHHYNMGTAEIIAKEFATSFARGATLPIKYTNYDNSIEDKLAFAK